MRGPHSNLTVAQSLHFTWPFLWDAGTQNFYLIYMYWHINAFFVFDFQYLNLPDGGVILHVDFAPKVN